MLRMKRKWMIVILCTLVVMYGSFGQVFAVEEEEEEGAVEMKEVVVTATRVPTAEREIGSSVTVITEEEIKAKGYTTVREVLKGSLGLDVVSTGGPGAGTSVFLRGANSYHTLVLIDGMEASDPSQTQRQYDLAQLTVGNIERVEIVRGPQSVLYGADAMGGVINIITKRRKEPTFYFGAEGGSYSTARQFLGLGAGNEWIDFSLDCSHIRTDGFSASDADLPGNMEDDAWENTTVSSRLGLAPTDWLDMGVSFRFHDGRTELDDGGGPNNDLEKYHVDKQEVFIRPNLQVNLFDGLWEQTLAYGLTIHNRYYDDHPWGDSKYYGQKHEISWQHNLYLHKVNTLTLGVEYEREGMESTYFDQDSTYTCSLFAQDQIKLFDISFTTVGIRWDNHEEFGDHVTFRVAQAFVFDKIGTTIKGSVGTGFRAPSLYELYSSYGDPNFDPEESVGWDVGAEQSLFDDRITLGVTYFHNEFDDLIDFNLVTYLYEQVDHAETWGVESFIKVFPFKDLSARVMYTYTNTDDDEGLPLLRRPMHKGGLNVCYRFLDERGTANLDVLFVGKRDDSVGGERVDLDEYVVVNLGASFKIHKYVELFAHIENLFDEDYEEAFGYGTPGFSVYGGVTLSIF
jgi:vitamin B12 transporter